MHPVKMERLAYGVKEDEGDFEVAEIVKCYKKYEDQVLSNIFELSKKPIENWSNLLKGKVLFLV